jgi:hypothetical protein
MRIPMMAITTSNSMSVNARREDGCRIKLSPPVVGKTDFVEGFTGIFNDLDDEIDFMLL